MELFDILVAAIWIFFIFRNFGSKKKRPQPEKEKYDYPQLPDEQPQEQHTTATYSDDEDIEEDERKLREWLDKVFGQNNVEHETIEEDYEEDEPAAAAYVRSEAERPALREVPNFPDEIIVPAYVQQKSSTWNVSMSRRQAAQGLIMSEILQKPRALRPVERIGVRPKQLKKG